MSPHLQQSQLHHFVHLALSKALPLQPPLHLAQNPVCLTQIPLLTLDHFQLGHPLPGTDSGHVFHLEHYSPILSSAAIAQPLTYTGVLLLHPGIS